MAAISGKVGIVKALLEAIYKPQLDVKDFEVRICAAMNGCSMLSRSSPHDSSGCSLYITCPVDMLQDLLCVVAMWLLLNVFFLQEPM